MSVITTKTKRYMEQRLRNEERKEDKMRANSGIEFGDESARPLLIRLLQDVGKLPANVVLQLPRQISELLLLRRLCTPVGDMTVAPDAIVDCEWADIGVTA